MIILKKLYFIFIIFIFLSSNIEATLLNFDIKPSNYKSTKQKNIRILDSKEFVSDKKEIDELSALAYDSKTLYALSDRGFLYHFDLEIADDKIKKMILKKEFELKSKKDKGLKKSERDSEGLVFYKGKLFISFERKHRIGVFDLDGKNIKYKKIHKDLQNLDNFKSENKGLESLVYSKKYGIITAPEKPLIITNSKYHTLYAKNKTWKFKKTGSITALEMIDKDSIMILEREFSWFTFRRVTTISSLNLKKCKNGLCKSKILAKLDTSKGWNLDNFEGLTKVGKNRYLMISDNNGRFYQKTLLVLFEIID